MLPFLASFTRMLSTGALMALIPSVLMLLQVP